jgi:hypothetical protein
LGSRRAAAYRISARAPTRSPQGGPAAGGQESAAERREEPRRSSRRGQRPRRKASEHQRASSTRVQPWIPTTKCVGMTAARCPAPCAGRAQPRQRRGRGRSRGGVPEWRNAPRGGRKRWRVEGARASRIPSDAKRSEDQHSGAAAPRLLGALEGRGRGGQRVAAQRRLEEGRAKGEAIHREQGGFARYGEDTAIFFASASRPSSASLPIVIPILIPIVIPPPRPPSFDIRCSTLNIRHCPWRAWRSSR